LQTLIENISDALISMDRQWRVLYVNSQAERLLKRTRAELLGKVVWDEFPEARNSNFHRQYERAFVTGQPVHFEEFYPPLDTLFEVRAHPTENRIDILFQDVTARQAVARLRESEAFNRILMDSSRDCVKVLDLDGRLLHMNGPGLCLLEVDSFDQVSGKEYHTLWPAETQEQVRDAVIRARAGEATRFRAFSPTAKGTPKWWSVEMNPVRDPRDGRVVQLLSISRDITEERIAEERLLRMKEEAERANQAKDRFLAVLSHELRTPLSPVMMAVSELAGDRTLDPAVREQMAMIKRNIELEARLIDDLLDLSRVLNGKLRFDMHAVNLHQIVRYALDTCAHDLHAKQLRLTVSLAAPRYYVVADPARLEQVLWNLLKNAIKFTPRGGTVAVSSEASGDSVRLTVSDNGIGLSEKALARIFEPFEQADGHITRQFGGLGLGLAISRGIVERHGGKILAHSDGHGRGSSFIVELPAHEVPAEAPEAPNEPIVQARSEIVRLLLVEDHTDTAKTLARLLRKDGYHVQTAHSVTAALELASATPFDLLVSDIGLPDATGYELMHQLKARYGLKGIAMTGYGMEEDLKKGREAGFSEHLVKPIDVARLQEAIRRVSTRA
jgi:PAS domain S-box-containing protein